MSGCQDQKSHKKQAEKMMTRELEIYIHIPFCVRKCAYCDFLSGPADQKTQEQYTDALIREIQAFPNAEQYVVCSVFIGGGTPSVLSKEAIGRILEAVRRKFHFVSEIDGDFCSVEITIECNQQEKRSFLIIERLESIV